LPKVKTLTIIFFVIACSTANGQRKALSADKVGRLVPVKLKGYFSAGAKNSSVEIGTIRYSLAERNFSRREKSIKILLFDYAEAPVMFTQAIRKWGQMNVVENDSVVFRPLVTGDSSAWESYSKVNQHYQVIMGINKRFFLTVNSDRITPEEVQQILGLFPFERYPK
jgi:hypothetical protein